MYRQFLNTHVTQQQPVPGRPKITSSTPPPLPLWAFNDQSNKRVAPNIVNNWQDPPQNEAGNIINEIAKKFNNHYTLPLKEVKYTPRISDSGYGGEQYGGVSKNGAVRYVGNLNLGNYNSQGSPEPKLVAHELVHANDHQIDNLNASTWRRLGELGRSQNNGQNNYPDFNDYNAGLKRIQDKIDPTTTFSTQYIPFEQDPTNHAKGAPDVKNGIKAGRAAYGIPNQGQNKYGGSKNFPNGADTPYSQHLFNDINNIVRYVHPNSGVNIENPNFFLNQASEYPAWISERLTEPWDTKSQQPGFQHPELQPQEARFLHDVLEDMNQAYPRDNYPTINDYIQRRTSSMERAYGGLNEETESDNENKSDYRSGGHVMKFKPRNGLSRYPRKRIANFIKTGRV